MDAADIVSKRIKGGCPLPEEMVQDILSRLPAKPLCLFRCVSRSFRAAISSRAFQDTHYQRSSGDRRRLFIRPPGVQEPFYACRLGGGGAPPAAAETIVSTRRLPQGSSIFPVSKSCRGLVLLKSTHCCTHYVWNPSTGEMSALPDKIPVRARLSWRFVPYGLCYCPATQRHKVVRMYDACGSNGYGVTPATICEVFTLRLQDSSVGKAGILFTAVAGRRCERDDDVDHDGASRCRRRRHTDEAADRLGYHHQAADDAGPGAGPSKFKLPSCYRFLDMSLNCVVLKSIKTSP
ncbi:hypothetical protein HU200_022334 [Digitaria exilis]|uniref:F-box domain-containing protein n=1 Tax=Digitaria exilis TaxID=1010633 RepID=A0A835EXF3_9POAL|nr:hypothetical protein HU200_022334 [Digitaria exilis]